MTEKVSSVTWARRRSVGPTMVPHMICVEKDGDANTKPIVGTMADSLGSLLTSMKLFGLYFKRGADAGDQSETRSNVYMIYSAVVLILTWVDVVRMFSVFKNTLRRSWRVCGVLVTVLRSCVSTSSSRCSQDKMSLEQFSSSSSVTFKTRIKGFVLHRFGCFLLQAPNIAVFRVFLKFNRDVKLFVVSSLSACCDLNVQNSML